MEKLKSTNLYYLFGILPLLLLALGGGVLLSSRWWVQILLGLSAVTCTVLLLRKTAFLPRPRSEYGDLKPLGLELPLSYYIQLYTSDRMAEYRFLHRTVEVLSPLWCAADQPAAVAVNPQLLSEEGEQFTRMEVVREIEKYRRKTHVKNVLGLAVPLLALTVLLELGIWLGREAGGWILGGGFAFFGAPAMAAVVVAVLYLWNKGVSKRDYLLDNALLEHFTPEEVRQYITRSEELMNREEKASRRAVLNHYAQERIARLK